MWKKQLNYLHSHSINLFRRNRIPSPCNYATAAASPAKITRQKASPPSSSRRNPLPEICSSSRAFRIHELRLGQPPQISNLFCSVSGSTFPHSVKCWNCNTESPNAAPFLVCQSCRCVQPLDPSVDFFRILGVERRYDFDDEDLEGKYKDWQKKLHPDLVHTKSQKEREYAAEQSARVNDAYRTLADPLSRAIYILKLQGTELNEEARMTDPELLAEIMELREAVEEAADAQALNQIQTQVQEKFEHWSKAFADAFVRRRDDEAVSSIQKMTYYRRAKEEITKKL